MVDRHISVPGRFTGGDFSEWIQRFEICSAANEWDEDAMARGSCQHCWRKKRWYAGSTFLQRLKRFSRCEAVTDLDDAMPNLDADSSGQDLVPAAISWTPR